MLVNPGFDLPGRGGPAQRAGDMAFDGADTFVPVIKQPFEPFRVQCAGARFEIDLLAERADLGFAARGVDNVNRRVFAFGLRDRADRKSVV